MLEGLAGSLCLLRGAAELAGLLRLLQVPLVVEGTAAAADRAVAVAVLLVELERLLEKCREVVRPSRDAPGGALFPLDGLAQAHCGRREHLRLGHREERETLQQSEDGVGLPVLGSRHERLELVEAPVVALEGPARRDRRARRTIPPAAP